MTQKYILGIDTSNYTSSVAVTDSKEETLVDSRKILKVKKGGRGLRQSDALFQHMMNLPDMLEPVLDKFRMDLSAVSVSDRPRNVSGSYMPVFNAGVQFGKTISNALNIPLYRFSHQEGHIAAGEKNIDISKPFIAFHLSGGTTEILYVKPNKTDGIFDGYEIDMIGGSRDISFGQLIDRIGVLLGYDFPSGSLLDKKIMQYNDDKRGDLDQSDRKPLGLINVDGLYVNLSGIETHLSKSYERHEENAVIEELFTEIVRSLDILTERVILKYNDTAVLLTGGVAASDYIRSMLKKEKVMFSKKELSSDNAVGVSLLGGKKHGLKAY